MRTGSARSRGSARRHRGGPRLAWRTLGAIALATALGCAGTDRPGPRGADYSTLRTTVSGSYVGFTNEYGSDSYLGIPFAQPPVGALRWRAPRALPPASKPFEALAFGASCPQFASPLGGDASAPPGTYVGDEDCLTLNVYAPKAGADEAAVADRPVMVWIHGGGNFIGTSSFYDGGRLAADEGAVVVTVNYRLGPFGWFRHPALAETASPAEQSGNFAVLDLIAGLQWVRENVRAFGGDPGNLTIFGESAGGQNVLLLMTSPLARGLFHRAISQSGGTWQDTIAEAENPVDADEPGLSTSSAEIAAALLARAGRAPDLAAARSLASTLPSSELAALLRGAAPDALLDLYDEMTDGRLGSMPRVFPDGVVLPADGTRAALARPDGHADVPILFGSNRDENKLFLYNDPEIVRQWFGLYPSLRDPDRFEHSASYLSRHWKATGVDELAELLAAQHPGRVFGYRFDWDEEPTIFGIELGTLLGASHGFEIPFVFGHWNLGAQTGLLFDEGNEAGREALSAQMRSYWVEFATRGAPGRGLDESLPAWKPWSTKPRRPKWMRLDTPAGGGLTMRSQLDSSVALVEELKQNDRLDDDLRCRVAADLAEWADIAPGAAGLGCPETGVAAN